MWSPASRRWPKVRILAAATAITGVPKRWPGARKPLGIDYVFGLPGNSVLDTLTRPAADALCVERATGAAPTLRRFAALRYGAKSWKKQRLVVARLEATPLGLDIRYVVTSLTGSAQHLYETVYCGRGQAENFIKLHKARRLRPHLVPDPKANQFRLILHTGAYWLLHPLRRRRNGMARQMEFRLRLRLLKIAARVIEASGPRSRLAANDLPDAGLFRTPRSPLCGRWSLSPAPPRPNPVRNPQRLPTKQKHQRRT